MSNQIETRISHESYERVNTKEEIDNFFKYVNDALYTIKDEVIKWHAYVQLLERDAGNFRIIAFCENPNLRNKMQLLINETRKNLYDK